MLSSEIEIILEKDKYTRRVFEGVFPCDLLPIDERIHSSEPKAFVINSKPSNHPGEHWMAFWLDGYHGEYMDSFGLPPPSNGPIRDFLDLNCNTLNHNKIKLQSLLSKTCGIFCIVYILKKARGENLKTIFHQANELRPDLNEKRILTEYRRLTKY